MNGQAERITRAVLEWRLEGRTAAAFLRLWAGAGEDDFSITVVERMGVVWEVDAGAGMAHLDCGVLLRVSVRAGADTAVYARTSLLGERLGLRGGVYDPPVGGALGL
jgi:hypothetical protein